MPDYFTHIIAAEIVYERLENSIRKKITSKDCYLLGAQGGDVFFAYGINAGKGNLGKRLHNMDYEKLLKRLLCGNISYAAGFATHYALDSELHPLIYANERKMHTPLAHIKIESDIGLYISRKYEIRRQILPRERVLAQTSSIYDSIKKVDDSVTLSGVERALKLHFYYTKVMFNKKRQTYVCNLNFDELSEKLSSALSTAETLTRQLLTTIPPDPPVSF